MEKELRIIISGGGTGGHIFPAVSIANAIIELRPDAEILFVGAEGRMVKDGKVRCYGDLIIECIYEYDLDSTPEQLDAWCKDCDFVFNLAGVNRPKNPEEFMKGKCRLWKWAIK